MVVRLNFQYQFVFLYFLYGTMIITSINPPDRYPGDLMKNLYNLSELPHQPGRSDILVEIFLVLALLVRISDNVSGDISPIRFNPAPAAAIFFLRDHNLTDAASSHRSTSAATRTILVWIGNHFPGDISPIRFGSGLTPAVFLLGFPGGFSSFLVAFCYFIDFVSVWNCFSLYMVGGVR